MLRIAAKTVGSLARGAITQNVVKSQALVSSRLMSKHSTESDEEFDARYESYFNRPDIDGWEIRKAMNDLAGMDVIPEPKIICAALRACRRVNDYALTVRFLEVMQFKTIGRKDIWQYLLQEIQATLDELGIDTPDKLGYDKPELALQSVYDIH